MPDIAMCNNYKCSIRDMCYRYRAVPHPYWQSFAGFQQDSEGNCDYLMDIGDWKGVPTRTVQEADISNKRIFHNEKA